MLGAVAAGSKYLASLPEQAVQAVAVEAVLGMVLPGELVVLQEGNQEHREELYQRLPRLVLGQAPLLMGGVVMVEPVPVVAVLVWELVLYVVVPVVPES